MKTILQFKSTVSVTLITNKASQRVMKKSGFQYERDIIHADLPHVLYRMKNPRKVEVVPYDTHWPDFFRQVAGLHCVSTSVYERQKGYGTAIEQFLLNRAKQLGYHAAVLQASQERLPLYLKQGFKECCIFKEFKQVAL